jgi:Xaa-Pro aminopeptidase
LLNVDTCRSRRDRLRASLDPDSDGYVVLNRSDIQYLSGFSGSNAALFVSTSGAEGDIFSTDGRYVEQAAQQCPDLGVLVARDCAAAIAEQCVAQGSRQVTIDRRSPSNSVATISGLGLSVAVVDNPVSAFRAIKDSDEIAALTLACHITSEAVDTLAREIRVGDSEIKIARRLEQIFGELGASDRSFATIVASGENSAKPHHEPGVREIQAGDLLIIDSGALVLGYHADMTRTFIVTEAQPWQRELHSLVDAAAAAAREAVRPGIALAALDACARDIIGEAGFGEFFGHGLGHGTGLDIHEAPMIGPRAEGRLVAETTITVEPGVYLPGRGGVRIEDSLLVTADGHRSLTTSPRDLLVVG